jgi:penicillin amidase
MLSKYPFTFRILVFFFMPIFVMFLLALFYLKSSVTPRDGVYELVGLNDRVIITHDPYGTPKIVAKTDHDAYFAIGFKHANDRLWQLELQRRLSQGRLSEILGSDSLSQDIWIRTLGLEEAARQSIPHLNKEAIDALNAYSEGVNAWISQANSLPIEFQILGIRPEPWSVNDSLSWQKMMSLYLSGNMYDEIQRFKLQDYFNPDQMKYIYPYDPISILEVGIESKEIELIAQRDTLTSFGIGYKHTGSNAWVVSGSHTESGHPMLANDPHLGLRIPALWYAATLKGDKLNASGMTIVGLPLIISGQNSDIAWGITNLMSDQQDLFIEIISPNHPNKYRNGKTWTEFEFRKEIIKIAPRFPSFLHEELEPVEILVRETVRGPIVSDVQPSGHVVISLRWTALDSEDHSFDSLFEVQYAKNWKEFRKALAKLKSPGLNYLYADRAGNIGYQAAGKIPHRGVGNGTLPTMTSQSTGWLGYYEFNLLPSILNPDDGLIVSANEEVTNSSKIVISHDWAPRSRYKRIKDLLSQSIDAGHLLKVEDMSAMQGDCTDLSALTLLPYFLAVSGETDRNREVITELKKWNGEFSADSTSATIFSVWSYYLKEEIFNEVLRKRQYSSESNSLLNSFKEQLGWLELAEIIATNDHGWCKPEQVKTCSIELKNSLNKTLKQIEKITGTKRMDKWNWGKFSRTEYYHQPFGDIKFLKRLFNRKTHAVASPDSINASNNKFDPLKGITKTFGSGFRQVFSLDDKNSHWYMLSSGQSGNLMSPNYDDMVSHFSINQLTQLKNDDQPKEVTTLIPSHEYLE